MSTTGTGNDRPYVNARLSQQTNMVDEMKVVVYYLGNGGAIRITYHII